MLNQLDQLYRDVILDHYQNSRHKEAMEQASIKAEGSNPLCGDELTVYFDIADGVIKRARFMGKGCAISLAAASMLMAELEGKTLKQAAVVIETMKALMQGEDVDEDIGDLEALAGVRKFPVRVKCAALSWNVTEEALRG